MRQVRQHLWIDFRSTTAHQDWKSEKNDCFKIQDIKRQYQEKLESQYNHSDTSPLWLGRCITGYKAKSGSLVVVSATLPDKHIASYACFEQKVNRAMAFVPSALPPPHHWLKVTMSMGYCAFRSSNALL